MAPGANEGGDQRAEGAFVTRGQLRLEHAGRQGKGLLQTSPALEPADHGGLDLDRVGIQLERRGGVGSRQLPAPTDHLGVPGPLVVLSDPGCSFLQHEHQAVEPQRPGLLILLLRDAEGLAGGYVAAPEGHQQHEQIGPLHPTDRQLAGR